MRLGGNLRLVALLRLSSEDTTSEVALAEVVLDSSLLGSRALGESGRATKGTRESLVLHADDADVAGTADLAGAGHALGHLDLDGEVGGGGCGETADADTGDVHHDLCELS